MQFRFFSFLWVSLLLANSLQAKNIGMEISYAEFMDENNQPYLELYFALHGSTVDFKQLDNGKFIGGVEVTVTLNRDSTLEAADKFRLLSPEIEDTSSVNQMFIHQLRFPVEKGSYTLGFDLKDINEPEEKYHVEQEVKATLGSSELTSSELLFLDSYEKSRSESVFSKSGYNLIPKVNSGTPYFNASVDKISFYTEVYNTASSLGDTAPYVIKYYIKDNDRNKVLNDYAAYSKKTAAEVEPLLASFSIADLQSGNYTLNLEVLNQEGEAVYTKSKFFYRQNETQPLMATEDLSEKELVNSFVNNLGGLDSIYQYVKYLYPISTEAQQNFQQQLLADRDLQKMKKYFYSFWSREAPQNPGAAWQRYHEKVKIANKNYATRIRPGYMSDRGRVFLVYGKPDQVDSRMMEPALPPYEIWQYGTIETPYAMKQTNKMFVFAEFNPSTNDYQLFHSTAIGELSSRRWRYDMANRYAGSSGNIDDDFRSNRDQFGSRVNNNIILNSTGADRDNR